MYFLFWSNPNGDQPFSDPSPTASFLCAIDYLRRLNLSIPNLSQLTIYFWEKGFFSCLFLNHFWRKEKLKRAPFEVFAIIFLCSGCYLPTYLPTPTVFQKSEKFRSSLKHCDQIAIFFKGFGNTFSYKSSFNFRAILKTVIKIFFLKKVGHSRPFLFIFVFSIQLIANK